MSTYRVAQVTAPNGAFALTEREIPDPPPGHVRIAVEACGVCHSDAAFVAGALPGVTFPEVPGHEIAGRVAALGERAAEYGWAVGDRVAVGWFGGSCGHCVPCRSGDFIVCRELKVPGWAYDGGFAEQVIAPVDALARIPDALTAADAGPMACAGVTVFNGLRRSSARSGDLVAVLGLGGLGHLAVQYAVAMGFETAALARGPQKADFAKRLGAHHYLDTTGATPPGEALAALGGARVVLATAGSSEAITAVVPGLAPRGELVVIGADTAPLGISPADLIFKAYVLRGHPSGTAQDVADTMAFSVLHHIRPMTETVPLADVGDAFARMLSGQARFRMVLTTG
ncbi:alcohol dehydrogenase catalytic domain-containing protein [Streptomyces sp. NPDC093252]|uniref:alcohol dehydrogenase catalytic domain-containing protein n=1 Tax=Streptomyces sp. NPDC093252 TaxID=3154980 RepID=UPI003423DB21